MGGEKEGREGGAELMAIRLRLPRSAWLTCEVKASGEANDLLVFRHGWIRIEPWHGQQFSYTTAQQQSIIRVNTGHGASMVLQCGFMYYFSGHTDIPFSESYYTTHCVTKPPFCTETFYTETYCTPECIVRRGTGQGQAESK